MTPFVLQVVGLHWAGSEMELLPGMPWEGSFGVLAVAGRGLIFFTAARMVCALDGVSSAHGHRPDPALLVLHVSPRRPGCARRHSWVPRTEFSHERP